MMKMLLPSATTAAPYNQADATGFINLFGLSTKVKALLDKNRNID